LMLNDLNRQALTLPTRCQRYVPDTQAAEIIGVKRSTLVLNCVITFVY